MPENSAMIVRYEWQVRALTREKTARRKDTYADCGAELLSMIQYHHDNRGASKILRTEMDKYRRKNPRKAHPLGDWIPYTVWYIRECLLGAWSRNTLVNAMVLLEEKGFISTKVPKDITTAFTESLTWIRFLPDAVNKWIDENCEKTWEKDWKETRSRISPAPIDEVVDEMTEEQITETADLQSINAMVNAICAFHRHIHNKNKNTVYDAKRKGKVAARIKERRELKDGKVRAFDDEQILGQCALVVIGNVVSPWHQGKDPEKNTKVYDDIELMFRDAKKFEDHMSYADIKGITWQIALREFKGFLQGNPSKYAKTNKKSVAGASEAQRDPLEDVKPEQRTAYRTFARAIAPFFLTLTEIKQIIEFIKTNQKIADGAKCVTNEDALVATLITQLKVFRPNGLAPEVEPLVAAFSKAFCRMQRLNS